MNCKIENQKSIEQIALEDYALNMGYKKSRKFAKIFGIAVSCLAVPFAIIYLDSKNFWGDAIGNIFGLFLFVIIVISSGMMGVYLFMLFADFYFLSKKTKAKVIFLLSEQDKKKIVKDYFDAKLKEHEHNIAYCDREIAPLKKSINYHQQEIEKLKKIKNL